MNTPYPLVIEELSNGEPLFISRGHHDTHEFLHALRRYGVDRVTEAPEHVYFKPVPRKTGGFQFYEYPHRISGAFPVTRCQLRRKIDS